MSRRQFFNTTSVFILLNWVVFALCFAWTVREQSSLIWWHQLNWHDWLTDLGGIVQLGTLQAGTFWILWLVLSIIFTLTGYPRRPPIVAEKDKPENRRAAAVLESDPVVQEKIVRLRQSLDNIR